jgi:hypothetical protein
MRVLTSDALVRRVGKISAKQFEGVNASVLQFLAETTPTKPRVAVRSPYRIRPLRTPLQRSRPVPSPFTPALSFKF